MPLFGRDKDDGTKASMNRPDLTSFLYKQEIVFLLGFYAWEYVVTFWFEWDLITRKITFKWYYISYLIARYAMLCVLCLLFYADRITHAISCETIHPVVATLALVASACATTNLTIRTVIIWNYHSWVTIPSGIMAVGQFCFSIYAGVTFISRWDSQLRTCLFEDDQFSLLAFVFIYTVVYDLAILVLTYVRIQRCAHRTRLWSALRDQGILYFVSVSAVNILAAVLIWMQVNDRMSAVVSPPATTISVVLSSQSVISLMRLNRTYETSVQGDTPGAKPSSGDGSGSQQLTTQIEFPPSIYNADSCLDLPEGDPTQQKGIRAAYQHQQPNSYTSNQARSSFSSRPVSRDYSYNSTLPLPVASSSKQML